MIRIKKVYIKNFKGIKDKKIIDFSDKTSLLVGPNGFGKTTIFDILELCITGKINRIIEKQNVTRDNADYKKPFYQNTYREDVVVKVWLENNNNEEENRDLIIVKYLPKDNSGTSVQGARKNKPKDFDLLLTYKELPQDFDKDEFVPISKNKITSKTINDFFKFSNYHFNIEKIYYLFNYLQQEDVTYFLKKSENDRKSDLAFLFQTEDEENKMGFISEMLNSLKGIKNKLMEKLSGTEEHYTTNKPTYNKLFNDKNYEFDKENIFENDTIEICKKNKEKYLSELNNLIEFINTFFPDEYFKKLKVEQINKTINNEKLIEFFILQNYLEKSIYDKLNEENLLFNNTPKLEAYVLQKYLAQYKNYNQIYERCINYKNFIEINEFSKQLQELKKFIQEFMPNKIDEYTEMFNNRKLLLDTLNQTDKTIDEIIDFRNNIESILVSHGKDLLNHNCPYCGTYWDSYENLKTAFEKREIMFKELKVSQSNNLTNYNEKLKTNFIESIKAQMIEYVTNNLCFDKSILDKLKEYEDKNYDFEDIKSIDIDKKFVWIKLLDSDDLKNCVDEIKAKIEIKSAVTKEVFDIINALHNISFDHDISKFDINFLEQIKGEFALIIDKNKKISIDQIRIIKIRLKEYLEKYKENYNYDNDKVNDEKGLFNKYFNSQKNNFHCITEELIEEKRFYIEYIFDEKQNSLTEIYRKRYNELKEIIERLDKLKTTYDKSIKLYKNDMIEKIKIPFYIYTAKILQNYQQGMGVFLNTKGDSDAIRFLTDSSNDHDAIHQLSSGQLSVVALAFTLAINKTYNISQNLKFLIIDDPIQDMDVLNIHSFVELIRHEFINNYQLIFSTHNDSSALYMKYKFEKLEANSVKFINVQKEFF